MEFKEFQKYMPRLIMREKCDIVVNYKKLYKIVDNRSKLIKAGKVDTDELIFKIVFCKMIKNANWKLSLHWLYRLKSGEGEILSANFSGMVIPEYTESEKQASFFENFYIPLQAIEEIHFKQ